MKNNANTATAESLFSNSVFLRNLAQNLIHDEHHAEDVVQDTWVAAIEKPPKEGVPVSAWLAGITKNLARKVLRGEKHRRKREAASATPESVRSADELVDREMVRRRVVNAVVGLKEPYRSTVLYRYYDNMPPRKIAKKLNLPLGTVKTRLHRGLEQLRNGLDKDYNGDRKQWRLALTPIAGLGALRSTFYSLNTIGILKIAASLLLMLSMVWVVSQNLPETNTNNDTPIQDVELAKPSNASIPAEVQEDNFQKRAFIREKDPFIIGVVKDKRTKALIQNFDLELERADLETPSYSIHQQTLSNAKGRFHIPNVELKGSYTLFIRTPDHIPLVLKNVEALEDSVRKNLILELDPGFSISGRVVEYATGRPIQDALVGSPQFPEFGMHALITGRPYYCVHCKTNASGEFTLSGRLNEEQTIGVCHPEFAQAWIKASPNSNEVIELSMKPGFCIQGTTLNDQGKPVDQILVMANHDEAPLITCCLSQADGSYRTHPFHAGAVELNAFLSTLRAIKLERLKKSSDFTHECQHAVLLNRDEKIFFGPKKEDFITWKGVVYGPEGNPCPRAVVWLQADRDEMLAEGFKFIAPAHCNRLGRFQMIKIPPGKYDLSVLLQKENKSFKADLGKMEIKDPGSMERDIHLKNKDLNNLTDFLKDLKKNPKPQMTIKIQNLFDLCNEKAEISFFDLDGKQEKIQKAFWIDEQGKGQCVFPLESGVYELILCINSSDGVYFYKNTIEISPQINPSLLLTRNDLNLSGKPITASGKLMFSNGDLIPDAKIVFTEVVNNAKPQGKSNIKSHFRFGEICSTASTRTGRYAVKGLKPGVWEVTIGLKGKKNVKLKEVIVLPRTDHRFILDLVIPDGQVSGSFLDGLTGSAPLGKDTLWFVHLYDAVTNKILLSKSLRGKHRFNFLGLAEGDYRITIRGKAYHKWESKVFRLSYRQKLNLAPAKLSPCGVCKIKVVNEHGIPIKEYSLYVNNIRIRGLNDMSRLIRSGYAAEELAPLDNLGEPLKEVEDSEEQGYDSYDELPLGLVNVRVKAKGYKIKEVSCRLEPHVIHSLRVILDNR